MPCASIWYIAPCTPSAFSVDDAQHDEAEVRHRRVRDQLLDVVLRERHQRAVDDADDRQDREQRRRRRGASGNIGIAKRRKP